MRRILSPCLFMSLFPILLFFFSPPVSATIQFVQVASANNQGAQQTSESVSFASTNSGDLLVVYVAPANSQPGTISVSDGHNAYNAATSTFNYGFTCTISQEFFYAFNITGGADTITATTTSATGMALVALEYSGVATTAPLDAQAGTSTTSCPWSTAPASASLTIGSANDLIVSGANLVASNTWTSGTGYTLRTSASNVPFGVEDQVVSSTGAYTGTFSLAASSNWVAAAVAFKAASASGTPICGHTVASDPGNDVPTDTAWDNPPVPLEGSSYVDPAFGCTVFRLTDGVNDASSDSAYNSNGADCATQWSGGPYVSMDHYYSTLSPINANDTYVLISSNDGRYRVKDISGGLVVPYCNMPQQMNDTRILWDASDGNVFYYTNGNSLMRGTISGSAPNATVTATTVHTFSQEYPNGVVDFMDAADLSQDGAHVVLVGANSTGVTQEDVFVYDFVTNTKGPAYTTSCTGSVNGANNNCLHKLNMTPDNYVLVDFAPDGTCPECGYRLWNGTTPLPHIQDSTNHLDTGYDLSGNPVFVALGSSQILTGDSNPCPSGSNSWSGLDVQQISNPASEACLLDNAPSWHVSYRGSSAQPWLALSYFDNRNPGPEWFENESTPGTYTAPTSSNWLLYEDEIQLAHIHASNNGTLIYRLARAYSRSATDYWATPHAAISRDGKYVIFDSNMAHVGGCPSGGHLANECSDVYLIKVQ